MFIILGCVIVFFLLIIIVIIWHVYNCNTSTSIYNIIIIILSKIILCLHMLYMQSTLWGSKHPLWWCLCLGPSLQCWWYWDMKSYPACIICHFGFCCRTFIYEILPGIPRRRPIAISMTSSSIHSPRGDIGSAYIHAPDSLAETTRRRAPHLTF